MGSDKHESDPPPCVSTRALDACAHRLVTMSKMPWFIRLVDGGCMAWWCMDQKSKSRSCMS